MNISRACINDALEAIDDAVEYILTNVAPGTPGKIEAVTELRHQARLMVFDFAHFPKKDKYERTDTIAA